MNKKRLGIALFGVFSLGGLWSLAVYEEGGGLLLAGLGAFVIGTIIGDLTFDWITRYD